ncbi:MAG: NAD(P)/FAD-dependent oxidoreductase [Kiloniellaceae bacterium]
MDLIEEGDIAWRSHWLQQALVDDRRLAPSLEGRHQADVCIVGGGYLGLWTAIRLKEQRSDLNVVILERDICGGGASGRNSGMLLSAWTKFRALAALRGAEEAARLVKLSAEAIDGIEAFCKANGIDCWFDRVGWVWGATCTAQVGAWDAALRGLADQDQQPAKPVHREEIVALTGSSSYLAGVFDASAATVHPAFLVRGLRRVALEKGVRIHEKTPMLRFSRSGTPVVETPRGRVEAGRLVLAINAWSAAVPELASAIFNISSDDAVSTPMPERLAEIGYARGPLMTDSRVFVAGYRVTKDGRLNVGVTGGCIGFGGFIDRRFDLPSPRVSDMRTALREGHPALSGFTLANAWRGAIDRTASGLPLFGRLPRQADVLYGYGFSGNGISMTYMGGHILAALALDQDDPWSGCALVRPVARGFPREPFRFVGAHLVRGAVRRRDSLEHRDRRVDSVTAWLAGLAPSGVTPSNANSKDS